MQDELLQLWAGNAGSVVFVTHDLEEAISLADRVFVLSARPATLKRVYTIDLPRPRVTSGSAVRAAFHRNFQRHLARFTRRSPDRLNQGIEL